MLFDFKVHYIFCFALYAYLVQLFPGASLESLAELKKGTFPGLAPGLLNVTVEFYS